MNAKKAFTLVELLVVIAIIGVLMAIGVFGYSTMIARAEQTKATERVQNAASALSALFIDKDGVWPKILRENGQTDGRLTETIAYPLGANKNMPLTLDPNSPKLAGLDRFGVVTPWAEKTIRDTGSSVSLSTPVSTGGTIQDHVLHFAVDLDGDGRILGAQVGGESVDVRATAIVWSCGKNGKILSYSKGRRSDGIYSWDYGKTQQVK